MTTSKKDIHYSGPAYITKAVHSLENGAKRITTSRRHRKGRGALVISQDGIIATPMRHRNPWLHLWAPYRLTWWVAILFTIGSACFSIGGYAITFPQTIPKAWTAGITLDLVFFIGSIFFTSAAVCQLLESINAKHSEDLYIGEKSPKSFQWIAWQPNRIGYMASLVQLIGTVMFNFNTGNAFLHNLNWIQQDIFIWTPNFIGCTCFLIASRLAFMEVCHGYWGWSPGNIEWWITVFNLLGSIGFMISALYSLAVPAEDISASFTWLSALFTFQGGGCFLIASYLLLPEMFSD